MRRLIVALALAVATAASAQPAPMAPADMVAAQQAAMQKIAALRGAWRGTGWMIDQPGETPRRMIVTDRVGPFLDGAVTVIEIRGYLADGKLGFHAFNTISFDAQKGEYAMNARASGRSGNFSFRPTADGYVWQIGAGDAGLRYTGTLKDGVWTEISESLSPGHAPVRMSETTLKRLGDTAWPEGGAIPPR